MQNAFADGISKMLIPEDWSLAKRFFDLLDARWGPHRVDLFASNANNLCASFFFFALVQGVCGHQCLRAALERREFPDKTVLTVWWGRFGELSGSRRG